MIAVSIFLLFLLAMASLLVYRLLERTIRRFFQFRRAIFYTVCISGTAIFFAAGCIAGLLSLNALRSTEYARGLAQAGARSAAALESVEEKQRIASESAWQEGYGKGFENGYFTALQTATENIENASQEENTEDSFAAPGTLSSEETSDSSTPSSQGGSLAEDSPNSADTASKTDDPEDTQVVPDESETEPAPDGTTVYYTDSGSVLHRDRTCSYLKKAKNVLECDVSEAPDLPLCSRCG